MNRRLTTLLVVSLLLILGGSLLAWAIQTQAGTIKIQDVRFTGSNGTPMSALLFIPPNATSKTPAPGILAVHGYINSRETQSGFAIEFARRGYVVLELDQTGHGYSGGPAFANGFGGPDGLLYLRSLDIVDKANIGMEGHSMGGWTSLAAAAVLKDQYQSIVLEGSSTGAPFAAEGSPEWPRNMALVYSKFDEFSQLMWGVPIPSQATSSPKTMAVFGTNEPIEVGKLYGSIESGTARMYYQPPTTHPGDHLSQRAIGDAIDWFQKTLKGGNGLDPANQVWFWKETGTLLAFIGLIMFMVAIGGLLLGTRAFAWLDEPLPTARPNRGIGWWIGALLMVVIPILTYYKFNHLADAPWAPTALFPQNLTTGIMFWAVLNGLISLVLFLVWHFVWNRKAGGTAENYGVTGPRGIEWGRIGWSFVLAVLIAFLAYLMLALADFLFKVDFRYWIMALKLMSPLQFRIFLGYLIPFAFFFLVLATVLHGEMRLGDDVPLWKAILVNVGLLIVGFIILLVTQYIPLLSGGTLLSPAEPLLTIVAWQFLPLLAIAAIFSTYFFRRTGRIYVGAFLTAIFVTWYIVASQATHFAF